MRSRWCSLIIAILLALVAAGFPSVQATGPAFLVKDIRPGSDSSGISHLTNLNGTLFFVADDGIHGYELWKSDGSPAGTVLVKDLNPGQASTYIEEMVDVNGMLFFVCFGGDGIGALWKSDGTADGTVFVQNVSHPMNLTNVDGRLFFVGGNNQLWTSNGTTEGTVLLKDFDNPDYHQMYVSNLTNAHGELFFTAGYDPGDLWKSNGTVAGTIMVKKLPTGARQLTDLHGTLFFISQSHELWKSDGTEAGTILIKDIMRGGVYSYSWVTWLAKANGRLFFGVRDEATASFTIVLWTSDGNSDGTVPLKSFDPPNTTSGLHHPIDLNGMLYFVVSYSDHYELWKSNGTPQGTVIVKNLGPGSRDLVPIDLVLMSIHGILLFANNDDVHGREPWISDGTPTGTLMLQDIAPGSASSYPYQYTAAGPFVFFTAHDQDTGGALWAIPRARLKPPTVYFPVLMK